MAPFVEALVDSTVRPGDAVLDVACGTGFAARAAAAVAGAIGKGEVLQADSLARAPTVGWASPDLVHELTHTSVASAWVPGPKMTVPSSTLSVYHWPPCS